MKWSETFAYVVVSLFAIYLLLEVVRLAVQR
jgi:hypothetical protein